MSAYFYQMQKKRTWQFMLLGAIVILLTGIILTVSRTVYLLTLLGAGIFFLQGIFSKNGSRAILIIFVGIVVAYLAADNLTTIFSNILPSITQGTDTVRIRYALWQAGWRMWLDNPIMGVGIGNFPNNLSKYASDLLPFRYLADGAHNMYVAVLSETGLIGLIFFVSMFLFSLKDLSKSSNSENGKIANFARLWSLIIMLVLLAGITKHDHYDKFNWITIGISASICNLKAKSSEK